MTVLEYTIFVKDAEGNTTVWKKGVIFGEAVIPGLGESLETDEHYVLRVTDIHHLLDGGIQILTEKEYPK